MSGLDPRPLSHAEMQALLWGYGPYAYQVNLFSPGHSPKDLEILRAAMQSEEGKVLSEKIKSMESSAKTMELFLKGEYSGLTHKLIAEMLERQAKDSVEAECKEEPK
jgi:hypothetical protein